MDACGRSSKTLPDFQAMGKKGLLDLGVLPRRRRAWFYPVVLELLRKNGVWTDYFYYVQEADAFAARHGGIPLWRNRLEWARALGAKDDREGALDTLNEAIRIHPHPALFLERGLIQGMRQQSLESASDLRRAKAGGKDWVALAASYHLLQHEVALGKLASAKSQFDDFQRLRRRLDVHGVYGAWDRGARDLLARLTLLPQGAAGAQTIATGRGSGDLP